MLASEPIKHVLTQPIPPIGRRPKRAGLACPCGSARPHVDAGRRACARRRSGARPLTRAQGRAPATRAPPDRARRAQARARRPTRCWHGGCCARRPRGGARPRRLRSACAWPPARCPPRAAAAAGPSWRCGRRAGARPRSTCTLARPATTRWRRRGRRGTSLAVPGSALFGGGAGAC